MATHAVFLPGKSHGRRSLAGYSPKGLQRVRHDWAANISCTHTSVWEGKCWSLSHVNSLRAHGLLCPWHSPGKNTRVGCHSLLQGILSTQGWNLVSCIAGRFFTIWATRDTPIVSIYLYNFKNNWMNTCVITWADRLLRKPLDSFPVLM